MSQIKHQIENEVDENQTKIDAALVVVLMCAYLVSTNEQVIYILIYDLLVRIYMTPFLSPIYIISLILVNLIEFKKRVADTRAKEFALHVGLTMLLVALFTELVFQSSVALLLFVSFTVWKIFEALKDICFACRFYEMLARNKIEVESL